MTQRTVADLRFICEATLTNFHRPPSEWETAMAQALLRALDVVDAALPARDVLDEQSHWGSAFHDLNDALTRFHARWPRGEETL